MADQTMKIMGDYEILGVLGAGGMGRVYRVRNTITDRIEAMKVLLPDLQGQDELAARFLREIKVLASLKHPNIAALHTALTIDNQLVMIMEYVEGESLANRVNQGPIPVENALNYIDQVLDALSYAHQRQIIHRDIKPANMMLTPQGIVKLMDFGIARTQEGPDKLTATGSTLGSINYMSPEQVKGAAIDARSDLYSVGISLYEMVTGQKPFHGDSNFSIMAAHLEQQPRPPVELSPNVPPILNELILKSIAKAPENRLQSADEFRRAVRAVIQSLQEAKTMVAGSMAETISGIQQFRPAVPPITSRTPVPTETPKPASAPTASVVDSASASSPSWLQAPTPTPAAAAAATATPPMTPPTVLSQAPPSHRGLYMALGAVVVLVGLILAGIYLPGRGKSSASAQPGKVATQPSTTPAITQPAPQPTTPQAVAPEPVAQTPDASAKPAEKALDSKPASSGGVQSQASAAEQAPAPTEPAQTQPAMGRPVAQRKALARMMRQQNAFAAQSPTSPQTPAASGNGNAMAAAELDELEKDLDQLQSRVAAVNSSLDRLRQQQAGAGYGLRGDIASKQEAMNVNLAKAQNALEHNEPLRARRFANMAAMNVEQLERFLGR